MNLFKILGANQVSVINNSSDENTGNSEVFCMIIFFFMYTISICWLCSCINKLYILDL